MKIDGTETQENSYISFLDTKRFQDIGQTTDFLEDFLVSEFDAVLVLIGDPDDSGLMSSKQPQKTSAPFRAKCGASLNLA